MRFAVIPLSALPQTILGADPSPALIKSVSKMGVLEPVLLVENPDGTFDIGSGRRRIKAARIAALETVPCVIHQGVDKHAIALITNQLRSSNIVVELLAAESLCNDNDPKDVCQVWHLNWQSFRRVLRLRTLIPQLRRLLASGELKQSVGERAAKLPVESQRHLANLPKIKMPEVEALFQARRSQAASHLSDELFDL